MPNTHTFDSTGEAYDQSQWRDDIHDGDVLHVPSEKVVGILYQAWPVALTKNHGEFHKYTDINFIDPVPYGNGLITARRLIAVEGYEE